MKPGIIFLFTLFALSTQAFNQNSKVEGALENEDWKSERFRLAIATINSYVPALESNKRIIIPAWGLEFEYQISEKWAIGTNLELEIFTYAVESDENVILRNYPFLASLLLFYEINEHFFISGGLAREIEENESFNLLAFSVNYAIILPENWDITPSLTYNYRFEAYDSFSFGIAFGKSF